MSINDLEEQFEKALSLNEVSSSQSVSIYTRILAENAGGGDDDELNLLKERSIYELAEIYSRSSSMKELEQLMTSIRPFFNKISKAKTGKIMRTLIDKMSRVKDVDYAVLIKLCTDCTDWCKTQKRVFLKQQIECKLCEFYLLDRQYQAALKLCNRLIIQIKKLDDKHLLVEIHLIESKIHHSLHNIAKAKAALTACRAAANSIYIGPLLQAEIDMQAGSISSEERDYKTSYSYFYEAFEGFDGLKDKRASKALKYMLLSKIMNDQPNDVKAVIASKLAIKYQSSAISMMQDIANAYKQRSLQQFEQIINAKQNAHDIAQDLVIKNKLQELKNKLLEQNLLRLLEPFEVVEIQHIADLMKLPIKSIQSKLSQMILDKKFNGILDQGSGSIIVFEQEPETTAYDNALQTIGVLNDVVDQLFDKAKSLD
eukprot:CAMPEP_0197038120 /NCGR_PEP_ID=MMETSP1384-20130603/15134_1 /TAXON_ID=29189 /ORGANISM="Ammonia sp." /LENGTH=426 /DNA_ID=CAMNT_0042468515 /DNA_START=80 /DNA_END=1360 /DNA_ORIENTATION=-